ncbi:MAG: GDSL-type esterase/lipase family protein, partial [Oscillospiraceae bacterium]|nr:GDSL-type esterase/lipase family protein [Oscillospiraceae bacterium]
LKGIGRYTGETVAEFEIIQNTQTVALPESGSSEMYVGETLLITMDLQAGETASFVSDDENVAEVNGYGLVTANRAGTAQITVTTGGSGSSAVRTLTVRVSLAPPEISDLTAGDQGVELTWDSVTGAETYEIFRRSDEDSDFETIGKITDTGEKSGTYTDTEAESGQTYTYYVVACCDNGDITSSPGEAVSITYLPAPRLMDVRAVSSTSFIASWSGGDEEDEDEEYEYELQYSTDPDFGSGVETIEAGGSATISRAVKDLEENTSYSVRVRTCTEVDGEMSYSGWSATKTVTTLDASQDAAEGKVRTEDWLTVFAGDSITYGLTPDSINAIKDIDIEGEKDVVAAESLNVVTFQTKDAFDGMTGVEKTISLKPDRVYSMIGLNDVAWRDHEQLIDYYTDIVQDLQEGCPGVDIVILSIPPVSRDAEERQPGFADIPDVNGELEAMAADLGVRYYDYTDAFKDSEGYILEEYGSGEFHWSVEGYALFGELISAYDSSLD